MRVDVHRSYAITSLYHWDQYWVRNLNVALRAMSYSFSMILMLAEFSALLKT